MEKETGSRSFGAFTGVFVPTFLSIIGVILFLRLGFVVGTAGTLGSIVIIFIAVSITMATALSLSSITTNIKIGAGGAYSIISKTLGLEVGGSVGIPLFLAQIFSVSLYILGFAEAWHYFFPEHNLMFVALGTFGVIFILTFISTRIAVKAQLAVLGLVVLSVIAIFIGGNWTGVMQVPLIGSFSQMPFWVLFALFFPAVTGLMAGIGLSGELSDAKTQIPKGVLSALIVTTIIYLAMVFWFAQMAPVNELLGNSLLVVGLSAFPKLAIVGILAAAFSSALTTFVAAPRVLQALSADNILPFSKFFCAKTKRGEPKNSILISGLVVVNLLIYSNLNSVAQVLTIFFLITYAMINISVFIEQTLALASFRPTFKISRFVSLYGAIGSIIIVFLISVLAGIASVAFIFGTYFVLIHKDLKAKEGDVRSGLFREFSEWAARTVKSFPESTSHTWKPNMLVPVVSTSTLYGNFPLLKALVYPKGTMTVLGFQLTRNLKNPEGNTTKEKMSVELEQLPTLVEKFGRTGIFTSFSMVEVEDYVRGLIVSMDAIESQVFPPNMVFLPFTPEKLHTTHLNKLVEASEKNKTGLVLMHRDPELGFGSEKDIHVWLTPRVLKKDFYDERVFDLGMLLAYKLFHNWNGHITVWMCVSKEQEQEAKRYLKKLLYEARYPSSTKVKVVTAGFLQTLEGAPEGDIHIIPFRADDTSRIRRITSIKDKSYLFVLDSSREDILS